MRTDVILQVPEKYLPLSRARGRALVLGGSNVKHTKINPWRREIKIAVAVDIDRKEWDIPVISRECRTPQAQTTENLNVKPPTYTGGRETPGIL